MSQQETLLTRKRDPMKVPKLILAVAVALLFLFPIVWMFFVSLKPESMPATTPFEWFLPPYTFVNYLDIIGGSDIFLWVWNSFIIGIITTILTLVLTSLAAFALSKMEFRYRRALFVFFIAGLMVPGEAMIIPLFEIIGDLNLLDTYSGLILPMIAAPLGVIILKSFFDGVPNELIESAQIDGCSDVRLFWNIVLPLARPALAAIGILTFIGSWNNFLWPYLATISESLYTLPVGIPMYNSNYSESYILPMTVNALASIPVIIAFLFFEKHIVKGISFTGIKG
ncbi:carbohydrate ABC transporter permease [Alkalicoccobacillus murimartini]|uniref:Multiple sugar transport system permease protein n=1 Tax=Alkalicoccobacillus murimartini TaxID=171685 RepID=A0ABT9YJF0_9BACI|nr:carbohydrate ABC transporter permease [Alkalicoccobacillus murimartini]MDQ0207819.1 multiple sugar transport system permease protein [Alkalicoccobacillus murimartini]